MNGRRAAAGERRCGMAWERAQGRFAWGSWAERGSATAEFAMTLPAVMALAVLLLSLGRVSMVSMACQDAANQVARIAVTGADSESMGQVVAGVAGGGASFAMNESADMVEATVVCPVLPGPLGVLPAQVEGHAYGVVS